MTERSGDRSATARPLSTVSGSRASVVTSLLRGTLWSNGLVAGLGLLLLASPPTPTAAQDPVIVWEPEAPRQGSLFRIRLTAPGGALVGAEGTAAGEALHFAPDGSGGLVSLAAVPVEITDTLEVPVAVRLEGASSRTLVARIPVAEGSYRLERLTVAPRFGRPLDPEDQARLDRDRAKARRVSEEAHRTASLLDGEAVLPRESRVTSGFGHGREFNGEVQSRHMGTDLEGAPGDPVRAAARGVVEEVDDFLLAGRIVYLNHGGGLVSGYFHLSEALVQPGDTVAAGEVIGRVGATGRVTGPHLHWVVRYGHTSVDPASLLDVVP